MVGLVLVSHSQKLAEGVLELANQMVQGKVSIAAAGGIDDPDNPIGTDPMRVMAAIESVYSDDGVLVLMDLGSALLSAETALEFLPPEVQSRVLLCAAPLVEGAVAAAVQAMVGATVEAVAAEAVGALAAKQAQLGVAEPSDGGGADVTTAVSPSAQQITLTIHNPNGLHARPAARFVAAANQFDAEIILIKGEKKANAKSLNQVAGLGVRRGEEVIVQAVGADAAQALTAVAKLAADHFGEGEEEEEAWQPSEAVAVSAADAGKVVGVPASPGVAVGAVAHYRPVVPEVVFRQVADVEKEWRRLETAVQAAAAEIRQLVNSAHQQIGQSQAAIFEAHLLFLQDPDLLARTKAMIEQQKVNAEAAWQQVVAETAETFRQMESTYMQARAADVVDVGLRVIRQLAGAVPPQLVFDEPVVLFARDLSPSDTAQLEPEQVLAICTEVGGATSHSAILARALGIPAVVGAGDALAAVPAGQVVAVNGRTGEIWLHPDAEQVAVFRQERAQWLAKQEQEKGAARVTAVTKDGKAIEIAANIGTPQDAARALTFGAEGVGLFRTEFLFLDRQQAPDEEEQYNAYAAAARTMAGKPLIIRTLDVGGDKPLPYLHLGEEGNPFLGWRGIRFCLEKPDIFLPQLRALLRASVDEQGCPTGVMVMFPMISTVDEVRRAKAMLVEAQTQLRQKGMPFNEEMSVGVMIEVPSAAAVADLLAQEVDFFSIGTNDLTQYVMAADRGNVNVAGLAQALQPAVLRMIDRVVQAAHEAGVWVGMCGELAGNVLAVPVLLGLGLDELSMNAPAIPAVKAAVRQWSLTEAQAVARQVLALDSVTAVIDYLQFLRA
ncbi:MAG: phosphoenolpyruvate--protein phosphotransferase [Candidatus Promineifilaceae bacterium]